MGSFFLIGLDPPRFWGGGAPWWSAGVSPALRALLGSRRDRPWRRSSLCAPGRARWVLRSAPDAFGMPFPPRRAVSSLSQPLEHSPTRARNAHDLAGPRTRWNAQTRSAPTRWPLPGTLATCLGRARLLLAPPARGRGPCPSLAGIPALGRRERALRSLLVFPPTTRCRAFVLPLRLKASPPSRLSRPGVRLA